MPQKARPDLYLLITFIREHGMTIARIALLAVVASLAIGEMSLAGGIPQSPAIEALIPEIQGKQPEEVRALIVARFGPPRDLGSGLRIEQWDVDGGALIFHPIEGVTFEKRGKRTRLIRTTNLAASCLFGDYEMVTLPAGRHGMTYWLGNVSLLANSRYKYADSRQNLDHRAEQGENFFIRHPIGSAQITYAAGVTPETRLEDLPDGAAVATVTFVGHDGRASNAYRVVAYRTSMSLAFAAEAMSFRLRKGWVNYWR